MKKLAILHFMPLEYYPPITNLLDFLGENQNLKVKVWTCNNIKNRKPYRSHSVTVHRSPFPQIKESAIFRLIKYWIFNLNSLVGLINSRPDLVLYYESYSAWPAFSYLKYFNSKAKLYIHFHEYSSKDWYEKGMKLVIYYHKLEVKFLFGRANWISQTNEYRLVLFKKDYPFIKNKKLFILSNYPPSNWTTNANQKENEKFQVVKLVYIGSVSLHTMFLKEFCDFVVASKKEISLDIFSYNFDDETKIYLSALTSPNIKFKDIGVEYELIPETLLRYDVGVILHKGVNENYKYNATNKLFEYLACGLEVWLPSVMTGALEYVCEDAKPRVLALDFTKLDSYPPEYLFGGIDLPVRKTDYFCEPVYEKLYKHMNGEG